MLEVLEESRSPSQQHTSDSSKSNRVRSFLSKHTTQIIFTVIIAIGIILMGAAFACKGPLPPAMIKMTMGVTTVKGYLLLLGGTWIAGGLLGLITPPVMQALCFRSSRILPGNH